MTRNKQDTIKNTNVEIPGCVLPILNLVLDPLSEVVTENAGLLLSTYILEG